MVWTFDDLRDKYERSRNLSKDFVIGDRGEYLFPSNSSPSGNWIVTRRAPGRYECTCPDFTSERYQDLMKNGWAGWQYSQWAGSSSAWEQYKPECKHILAVQAFTRELDPANPFPQFYTPIDGLNKPSCGCQGGTKPCGCAAKKKLRSQFNRTVQRNILGCPTGCHVPSLSVPQVTQPDYVNQNYLDALRRDAMPLLRLIPPSQVCGDFASQIGVERVGNTQGYAIAQIFVDLDGDRIDTLDVVFEPAQQLVYLDYFVVNRPFSSLTMTLTSTVFDVAAPSTFSVPIRYCPPCETKQLASSDDAATTQSLGTGAGIGDCVGNFKYSVYQTGDQLPDGSCDVVDYYTFDDNCADGVPPDPEPDDPFPPFPPFPDPNPDDPFPPFPPFPPIPRPPFPDPSCRFTVQRNCVGEDLPDSPECSSSPFQAVYCIQNGETTTKNTGGICEEICDRECIEVRVPECAQKPCDKGAWACPSKDRYIGWFSQNSTDGSYDLGKPPLLGYFPSGSVDTGVLDAFYCKDVKKVFVLVGYTIPPKAYLKDGNCIDSPEPDCKFNENVLARPCCGTQLPFQPDIYELLSPPYLPGWYLLLRFSKPFSGTSDTRILGYFSGTEQDVYSIGPPCQTNGGLLRLLNGVPNGSNGGCMSDSVYNPIVFAEFQYYKGTC